MVLDHKGVVRYFEIYHDVSSIYLVMEYLDGQSIEKYFADEKRVKRKIKDK
jgi:serine/threonine protein kinase